MNWEDQKFAIVDIETTGGNAVTGKITEVAIFVYQNGEIIDSLESLINPEQNIPYFIASLTGIDNAMVANSPRFFELAKAIIKITEETIFVAHNVNFDYGFFKEEFKQLGYDYQRKTLDTVQLARKILPGHSSYSLGKLCQSVGLNIENRHRASGDAKATVELFDLLVKTNALQVEKALTKHQLRYEHPFLSAKTVDALPETSGIYCFKNSEEQIIYIGKSINIRQRVISHLNNTATKKNLRMLDEIKDIGFRETGSELIALLEESNAIKLHKPKYNRMLTKSKFSFGLIWYYNDFGYICFKLERIGKSTDVPLITFSTLKQGKQIVDSLCVKYSLCRKLCGLDDSAGACFYHPIGECKGACVNKETHSDYNSRAIKVVQKFAFQEDHFIIIDRGRNEKEKSVVYIKASSYYGHAYVSSDLINNIELLKAKIPKLDNNRDTQRIVSSYMNKHPEIQVIYL
ncbi:MAG: GIY-YIG nuclease family protein [Bacteroidales bacterium]|nr:GIY-YIG nuclease family protein [Bacteroidales bacterium]